MKSILLSTLALLFSMVSQAQEIASTSEHSTNRAFYTVATDTVKNKKGETLDEVVVKANQYKKCNSSTLRLKANGYSAECTSDK